MIVIQRIRALAADAPDGARLPSVRALMEEFRCGPQTVQAALAALAREGVIDPRPGRGTFVRPRAADARATTQIAAELGWQSAALGPARASGRRLANLAAAPPEGTIPLDTGFLPPALQAGKLVETAAARALRRPSVWARMPADGLEPLRTWFAQATGGAFAPHEVTICPGTQAALSAAFRALAASGDNVIVESPTYGGAIEAAEGAGLTLVPVPTDHEGVLPEALDAAFARSGARLFYGQPTYANPTGTVLPPGRRDAVRAVLARHGAFMIEDDWARDFTIDGDAPVPIAAADPNGHIVYTRSLTKSTVPGLRVGAICAKGAALVRLRATRLIDDLFVPGLMQETALGLVTAPGFARHLRAVRFALRARRDALCEALERRLGADAFMRPAGGLHLWLRLPDGVKEDEVAARAASRGVLVGAGALWFPAEPPGVHVRLSFASAEPAMAEHIASVMEDAIDRSSSGTVSQPSTPARPARSST